MCLLCVEFVVCFFFGFVSECGCRDVDGHASHCASTAAGNYGGSGGAGGACAVVCAMPVF